MAATRRARVLGEFGSLEAYRDHLQRKQDVLQLEFAQAVARLSLQLNRDVRRCEDQYLWTQAAIGRRNRRTPRK